MFKNTMKTTVLLAALGGLIVTVAGLLGGGSSGAVMIGVVIALVMVGGSYWCGNFTSRATQCLRHRTWTKQCSGVRDTRAPAFNARR